MKASNYNLLEFLKQSDQLEIPVYQRPYSWTKNQCQQLWDDLISLSNNKTIKNHFMGFIVSVTKQNDRQIIIDGQQRLVTISLLLAAINKVTEGTGQKNDKTRNQIKNLYLLNKNNYKMLLNKDDQDTYISIINNMTKYPPNVSMQIKENFEFFVKNISNENLNFNDLFKALKKLDIIAISLKDNIDNPQLIFDSLNSTGLKLKQSEQIKNYVLMGIKEWEQEILYNHLWKPMELEFDLQNDSEGLEKFLGYYLTIQNNGNIPEKSSLYSEFIKFFNEKLKYQTRKDILSNIFKYSKFYLNIINSDFEEEEVRNAIKSLNKLSLNSIYPFLMEVMEDYESNLIETELLCEILKSVEAYVSDISEDSTNSSEILANLGKNINHMLASKTFNSISNEDDIVSDDSRITINDLINYA